MFFWRKIVIFHTKYPFQVRGAHLKKLRRAEEGAKILGVFRVKNHYFTPKNHSFYNYGGRRAKLRLKVKFFWSDKNGVVGSKLSFK
jgi:hypothetical protein